MSCEHCPHCTSSFGGRVRRERLRHGLSVMQLAERMGNASHARLSQIENGSDTKLTTARRIAVALGVTLSSLIGDGTFDDAEEMPQ